MTGILVATREGEREERERERENQSANWTSKGEREKS